MYMVYTFFLIPILIPLLLLLFAYWLIKYNTEDEEKSSPFECGFDPICSSRTTLTVRFYLMAIIFLIFDVEIVLILPLILVKSLVDPIIWTITFSTLIVILVMGLFYEWKEGTFNWSD